MHEPRGHTIPLSGPRVFVADLVHFARKVPTVPVSRTMQLGEVAQARLGPRRRISWTLLFMKAFSLVAREHAPLRRTFVSFPAERLYEHPQSIGAMAMERDYLGEPGIFVGLFRAPEAQTVGQLQDALDWYKQTPLSEIGVYRQLLRVSRLPRPVRHFLWWTTLDISGFKKAKRFGTFGLSSYGSLGAEQIHPLSPLTTTLTYGPINPRTGEVTVKLVYDHRVLDGAWVARRLSDIEEQLSGPIREELRHDCQHPRDRPALPAA